MGSSEPRGSHDAWKGRFLTVAIEQWPQIGDYEVVRKHDAVAVVPVTPAGDVVLVKQFRPPVRASLTEVPAGLLDVDGEDAMTCADRELLEETGFRARSLEFLGGCYLSPGFTTEYVHLFWARVDEAPERPPEEGIELVTMPLAEAVTAARAGRFRNVTTALALLLAEQRVASSP